MVKKIYGVKAEGSVTPLMVRNAIINCFINAHGSIEDEIREYKVTNSEKEVKSIKRIYSENLVRKMFDEIGADFDNPTKKDLIKVCDKLADFSKNFRDKKIIKKHYTEIMELLKKVD